MKSASLKIAMPTIGDFEQNRKFQQSALKLYRARQHAHEVSLVWETVVEQHFNAATGEAIDLPYAVDEFLINPPIPVNIPFAIGDCIRNLRSALDYLVSEMARAARLPDKETIFPFSMDLSNLKASFNEPVPRAENRKGRRAGALYDVSLNYPNLEDVILNQIRPYSADHGAHAFGDTLWRIITADNIDKHRLMTPVVQRSRANKILTIGGGQILGGGTIQGHVFTFPPGTKLHKDCDFTVDIAFEEPTTLSGKPVTSSLIEGCNAVAQVIEIFRGEFELPAH